MKSRVWNVVAAGVLLVALCVLGAVLPVPIVALGPGPTYDTLGEVEGARVVDVQGVETFPPAGHLNMTTVSVTDRLSLFSALGLWADPSRRLVPRSSVYPPGRSDEQVQADNAEDFESSEINAESAALLEIGVPAVPVVASIVEGSPAAAELEVGDELRVVNGVEVTSPEQVPSALTGTAPGATVTITYVRDGEERSGDVVLAESPDREQGFLGIVAGGRSREGSVAFNLAGVGGPSAGLMFSLSLIDQLTPGDLTGGMFVAGTGAVSPSGEVSPIGGIPFKLMAAAEVGATVFLVPVDNCAEAATNNPEDLTLVRVGSVHEATSALETLVSGGTPPLCTP